MIEDAIVRLEVILGEECLELFRIVPELEGLHGIYQVVGVGEVLVEEVENHVSSHSIVAWIHGELAEEVSYGWLYDDNCAESVPKIIKCEDAFPASKCALVLDCDEAAAQFDGPRSIVLHETFREAEHMTGSQDGLTVRGYLPVFAENVAVAAYDLFRFGVPYKDLLIAVVAGVELVEVETLSRSASCCPECYFAKTSYLAYDMRGIVPSYDIDFVAALVCHAQTFVQRELRLQHFCWDWGCYGLHFLVLFH